MLRIDRVALPFFRNNLKQIILAGMRPNYRSRLAVMSHHYISHFHVLNFLDAPIEHQN